MQTWMSPHLASVVPLTPPPCLDRHSGLSFPAFPCGALSNSSAAWIEIWAWGGRRLQEGPEKLEDEKRGEKGAGDEEGGW